MQSKILRSSILENWTIATERKTMDLPIHPLSHLIVAMAVYNATDEATLAELLAFINSAEVTKNGRSIFNLESEDISAMNYKLFRSAAMLHNNVATDNAERILGLVIPFGRRLYNPAECLPGSLRGETKLTMDMTIPSSSADNGKLWVEAVQLPNAKPKRYLKSTQMSVSAPGSTGEHLIDLPINNTYAFLSLRHTTYTLTGSHTWGINDVAVMANDNEYWYTFASTPCMIAERMLLGNTLPRTIAAFGQSIPDKFTYVDFDPDNTGAYMLPTSDLKNLKLKVNYGVDEAIVVNKHEIVQVT